MLSKVNHKNFVNLLGFCEEEEPFTRMMVFEYAPNGTLFEHLHSEYLTIVLVCLVIYLKSEWFISDFWRNETIRKLCLEMIDSVVCIFTSVSLALY